jgi:hypothetical protein
VKFSLPDQSARILKAARNVGKGYFGKILPKPVESCGNLWILCKTAGARCTLSLRISMLKWPRQMGSFIASRESETLQRTEGIWQTP